MYPILGTAPYHKERNKMIAIAVLNRQSQTVLAKLHGISKTRVSQITWKAAYQVWPELVFPYMVKDQFKISVLREHSDELIKRLRSGE